MVVLETMLRLLDSMVVLGTILRSMQETEQSLFSLLVLGTILPSTQERGWWGKTSQVLGITLLLMLVLELILVPMLVLETIHPLLGNIVVLETIPLNTPEPGLSYQLADMLVLETTHQLLDSMEGQGTILGHTLLSLLDRLLLQALKQ